MSVLVERTEGRTHVSSDVSSRKIDPVSSVKGEGGRPMSVMHVSTHVTMHCG